MSKREKEVQPRTAFAFAVSSLQLLGLGVMVMTGIWMGKYREGFAWDGSTKQFNYHPVFMVIGMIFLNSEGMIIYRVFSQEKTLLVKLLHTFIQIVAFIIVVVGLKAVFDFHNHNNIPNMYTLHSWLGITVVVLFTIQWICGFSGFLFPKLPDGLRASYIKIHVFFGKAIFLLAIATCLAGITEKAFFSIPDTYRNLPAEAVVINMLGVMLVLHGGLTYFIVTNENFKRVTGPVDEEHSPLVGDSTKLEEK